MALKLGMQHRWERDVLPLFTDNGKQKNDSWQKKRAQDLNWSEPPHDKTNKMTVRPAKTRISLGIRPVWPVFAVRSVGS